MKCMPAEFRFAPLLLLLASVPAVLLARPLSVMGFRPLPRACPLRLEASQNGSAAVTTDTAHGGQHFDQAQALASLSKQIAGSEGKPAGDVYKNIVLFKQMPAGRLLMVMTAFSRALGTDCTHCHDPGAWEKDVKPTKQIARDMFTMVIAINNDYLKNIKNLKSATPTINCTTCHRGQLKPEINLPEPKPDTNK